jgi:hypothetical protein
MARIHGSDFNFDACIPRVCSLSLCEANVEREKHDRIGRVNRTTERQGGTEGGCRAARDRPCLRLSPVLAKIAVEGATSTWASELAGSASCDIGEATVVGLYRSTSPASRRSPIDGDGAVPTSGRAQKAVGVEDEVGRQAITRDVGRRVAQRTAGASKGYAVDSGGGQAGKS